MNKFKGILCFLVVALCFCAANSGFSEENRQKIFVGYSVEGMTDVDPKDAEAALRVWAKEIGANLGFDVEITLYQSVDNLIRDFSNRKLDFVSMQTLDFLKYTPQINIKPDLAVYRDGKIFIHYVVLVAAGSKHQSLETLKNSSLAMLKTNHLGKLYLDTQLLKSGHAESDRFFQSIREKTKESQALLDVFFGQAQACIVTERTYRIMAELNPQISRKLRVISQSPDFIDVVGFFSPHIAPSAKQKALRAMQGEIKSFERGRQIMLLFNVENMGIVHDAQLDNVRDLLAEHARLKSKK